MCACVCFRWGSTTQYRCLSKGEIPSHPAHVFRFLFLFFSYMLWIVNLFRFGHVINPSSFTRSLVCRSGPWPNFKSVQNDMVSTVYMTMVFLFRFLLLCCCHVRVKFPHICFFQKYFSGLVVISTAKTEKELCEPSCMCK